MAPPSQPVTPPSSESARTPADKISQAFAARLAALPPGHWVRTLVLPVLPEPDGPVRGAERAALLENAKQLAAEHFAEVDRLLETCGGRRVGEGGSALGAVVVDATPAAVHALCDLPWVHAVLEDQPIKPIG